MVNILVFEEIDFAHTEFDDLSLKIDDSSFDFDSIKDWIIEDPDTYMAGSNPDSLIVGSVKAVVGVVEPKESTIEKEMEKFSLKGGLDESVAEENKSKDTCSEINEENTLEINCDDQNPVEKIGVTEDVAMKTDALVDESSESGESESESSESSSSSSESSSSSSDDDDDNADVADEKQDIEEGEIRDSNANEMAAWTDEEDEAVGVKAGPVTSKNELQVLPHVPPVNVTLQPSHQTSPVGVVISIVDSKVIVEGVENHSPLNEGSILWITETRLPLGLVDEIFGPVENPYYIVRYNSEDEVPKEIHEGTLVSFVPEFVNYVLINSSLKKKGYDASNEYDEELSDELEFSDDEKEKEYRKMKKQSKRVSNDQDLGNRNGGKKKSMNKGRNKWKSEQNPSPTPPPVNTVQNQCQSQSPSQSAGSSGPGFVQGFGGGPGTVQPFRQVVPNGGAWGSGMMPGQQPQMVQGFPGGPTPGPMFGQMAQGPGFPGAVPNGVWMNGMMWQPCGLPGGFQFNPSGPGIPPSYGAGPFFPTWQPQPNMGPPNGMLPPGVNPVPPNFGPGPNFGNWQPNQGGFNQPQVGMGQVNMGENGMMMSPANSVLPPGVNPSPTGPPQGFNQGSGYDRGGRGSRGGGRFGRGRGRHQPK
jgi:H/ACA ribonucleoprotein complex non-core subunit NAF1